MLALFPMGVPWRWKAGVSETANGDATMVRSLIGSPVYRRSTRGAEVEVDRKSASGLAAVYIARPFRSNVFFQKVRARMNNRAGTLLAGLAMTDIRKRRFIGHNRPQRTAVTSCNSFHDQPSNRRA